jgi:hypothetical protein
MKGNIMRFTFKHPKTKDTIILHVSDREIQNILADDLRDRLTCTCEPVGETNCIDCNCEEYYDELVLQERT